MTARGIRNNNPLNIRLSKDNFIGEIKSTDKVFKQFESPEYGYRAAFIIIATYLSRGLNTLEKIIGRWAPTNENYTEQYVDYVSGYSGIDIHKQLNSKSGWDICKIVEAMSCYENGEKANFMQIKQGFLMQDKITV